MLAAVNSPHSTSTTGAIHRLGDKTKGSFLKTEETTGPAGRSWNAKPKADTEGTIKAVGLVGGLGEGNTVTLRIFPLFLFIRRGHFLSFQINPTHITVLAGCWGDGCSIFRWLAAEERGCVDPDSPFGEPLPASADGICLKGSSQGSLQYRPYSLGLPQLLAFGRHCKPEK